MSTREHRRAAMTLIEVLVVLVLIAVVAAGSSMALGAIAKTNLRSASVRIAAAAKEAYRRAVTQGKTVRVVIDAENHTIAMEEAPGNVLLRRSQDKGRDADDAGEAVDSWEVAKARLGDALKPVEVVPAFTPIRSEKGKVLERFKPKPLGDRIRVAKMFLPHEPEPRTEGQGAIYFFPGGRTEHAVVQLEDAGQNIYSVEIHPLTARITVHTEAFEPESLNDDEEGEVRDPS